MKQFHKHTLYFLNKCSMPPVRPLTLLFLASIILSKSMLTSFTMTPWCLKSLRACSYKCDECSSALEGMQPTFKHVPPRDPRDSTHAVCTTRRSARGAVR